MDGETWEIVMRFDARAAAFGADGLCFRACNTEISHFGTNRINKVGEISDFKRLLQNNYNKLVNCLCSTDDIAAKLFEENKILTSHLESIQNMQNKICKNEILLGLILKAEMDVFESFIKSLQDTKQYDLFLSIRDGIDISADHVKIMQKNYTYLIENIDPSSGFLNHLFQSDSLTRREIENIESKETGCKKNQELLSLFMRKSVPCFVQFIQALKMTKQMHIALTIVGWR